MKREAALLGLLAILAPVAQSQRRIVAVVNSASFEPGLPSGGALATVLCTGIDVVPGLFLAPATPPLPLRLGGLGVDVNGWPAPIVAVFIPPRGESAYAQINFQVPIERNATLSAGGADLNGVLTLTGPGGAGAASMTPTPGGGRGGFFKDADGFAAARHASDESLVTVQNPARPGETIIVYANDFFVVWPPPPIGLPVPEAPVFAYRMHMGYEYLYLQEYPASIDVPPGITGSFANTPAVRITFRGLARGRIGVQEIHFVVPANQRPGDWALFFNRGSCPDRGEACDTSGSSSAHAKPPVR